MFSSFTFTCNMKMNKMIQLNNLFSFSTASDLTPGPDQYRCTILELLLFYMYIYINMNLN
jgi:hypothetical protein